MLDPAAEALARAPLDDEPFTEEDRLAIAEADHWLEQNQPIRLEAFQAEFGLDLSDWEKMGKSSVPSTTDLG